MYLQLFFCFSQLLNIGSRRRLQCVPSFWMDILVNMKMEVTKIILRNSWDFASCRVTNMDFLQILDFLIRRASLWISFRQLRLLGQPKHLIKVQTCLWGFKISIKKFLCQKCLSFPKWKLGLWERNPKASLWKI